ncbi:MAG: L,D-transpeptidase family protein [Chthoniobacterales bacterium]
MLTCFVSTHADGAASKNKNSLQTSSTLGSAQEKGKIFQQVFKNNANEPVAIRVSLLQQRVFVFLGNQLAISSPISSGRRPGWTPEGSFKILEKDPVHRSSLYGNFVDQENRIIRGGIDSRRDSAPSGTHFQGAPMLYFMRLTDKGVGMHVGILPGYPASHGCIRLPEDMAKVIYETAPINTPVTIEK